MLKRDQRGKSRRKMLNLFACSKQATSLDWLDKFRDNVATRNILTGWTNFATYNDWLNFCNVIDAHLCQQQFAELLNVIDAYLCQPFLGNNICTFYPLSMSCTNNENAPENVLSAQIYRKALIVVSTGDMHSRLLPCKTFLADEPRGGVVPLALHLDTYRRMAKETDSMFLYLDAGDLFDTHQFERHGGKPEMACMAALQPDALGLGNHDLEFGWPAYEELLQSAGLRERLVCCNVFLKTCCGGRPLTRSHVDLVHTDIDKTWRVAVIGIMGRAAFNAVPTKHRECLAFVDPLSSLHVAYEQLCAHETGPPDCVIVLSHAGIRRSRYKRGTRQVEDWATDSDNIDDVDIARLPFVDMVASGHTHDLMLCEAVSSTQLPDSAYREFRECLMVPDNDNDKSTPVVSAFKFCQVASNTMLGLQKQQNAPVQFTQMHPQLVRCDQKLLVPKKRVSPESSCVAHLRQVLLGYDLSAPKADKCRVLAMLPRDLSARGRLDNPTPCTIFFAALLAQRGFHMDKCPAFGVFNVNMFKVPLGRVPAGAFTFAKLTEMSPHGHRQRACAVLLPWAIANNLLSSIEERRTKKERVLECWPTWPSQQPSGVTNVRLVMPDYCYEREAGFDEGLKTGWLAIHKFNPEQPLNEFLAETMQDTLLLQSALNAASKFEQV